MQSPGAPSTTQTRLESYTLAQNHQALALPLNEPKHDPATDPLRVYVLCGVVGSGKSTLAVQAEALYPRYFVRVNQDSLGSRAKCEKLASQALFQGKSVFIDRQNFDPSQRYTWLEIGHSVGAEVVALVFSTSKSTCADRLRRRINHETIHSAEQGIAVLENITSIWQPPTPSEGFHRIVNLPADLPLRYSYADIDALLDSVSASQLLPAELPPAPLPTPRGAFFAGRGRGRGSPVRNQASPGSRNLMSSWLAQPRDAPSALRGASRGRPVPYSTAPRGRGRSHAARTSSSTRQGFIEVSSGEDTP